MAFSRGLSIPALPLTMRIVRAAFAAAVLSLATAGLLLLVDPDVTSALLESPFSLPVPLQSDPQLLPGFYSGDPLSGPPARSQSTTLTNSLIRR